MADAVDAPLCPRCMAAPRRQRDGEWLSYCRSCRAAYVKEWRAKTPQDKERSRERHLLSQYGITQGDYDAMVLAQGGKCAICERPPWLRPLNVDHDHSTGAVRGLLCDNCNKALGLFRDDTSALTRAIEYIKENQC